MSVVEKNYIEPADQEPLAECLAPHRWTLAEYEQLGDAGLLNGCRTELIDGEIFDMPPQKDAHRFAVESVFRLLAAAFDKKEHRVTCQATLRLAPGQAPEPDLAVQFPPPANAAPAALVKPLLVVEVSDATLTYDRQIKSRIYASYDVQDYWIVNLIDRQLEVHRQPMQTKGKWQYAQRQILRPGEKVNPLCKPQASIDIAEMFT